MGKLLIQREHGLPFDAHESRYLTLAGNADRWGALAVGASAKPSVANLASPRLPQLETLSRELLALFERRPPVDGKLRRRLMATAGECGKTSTCCVRQLAGIASRA
jgi:serine/threonine-protein kinase HipA